MSGIPHRRPEAQPPLADSRPTSLADTRPTALTADQVTALAADRAATHSTSSAAMLPTDPAFTLPADQASTLPADQASTLPADQASTLPVEQAARLLDRFVYEQVLECIDLDSLYRLEQSLTMLAGDLDGITPDRAAEVAKSMLDSALLRLPDDMRRYLRAIDSMHCEGCILCEEEAREAAQPAPAAQPRRGSRIKS